MEPNMFLSPNLASTSHTWAPVRDPLYDEDILPALHELVGSTAAGAAPAPDNISGFTLHTEQPVLSSFFPYSGSLASSQLLPASQPLFLEAVEPNIRDAWAGACVDNEKESAGSRKQTASPSDSSTSKQDVVVKADRTQTPTLDKKAQAKLRYREKNRKAQARHRERNKKTIEDLTARVSALTAENSDLKLEMAIVSTVARAKDEHFSKLRRAKQNLVYVEAESLIAESYGLASGSDAEVSAERLETWCLQDSAAVRQASVQRLGSLLSGGEIDDVKSPVFQRLQAEMKRKRQLSLRFAVGKPGFVRSLYAWEREYCKHLDPPDFEELWRKALKAMHFTDAQRLQMVHARCLLIAKMHTILNERRSMIEAAKAGAMEGVADVLSSSLEEERQAVFGFLFTFFDETLTTLQECICDVQLYPWAPDVLAMSDILMEEAVAASSCGLEGLNLPSHVLPSKDGRLDVDALLPPTTDHLAALCNSSRVEKVASVAGIEWPPQTPFQQLSVPVTTRSCATSGVSLLRNKLMFAGGIMPVKLPAVPIEVLTRVPILRMIRQHPVP